MVYTRASSDDFDRYAAVTGDDGWNWDNMQQYFLKNERWTEPNDGRDTSGQYDPTYHSSDGMTSVSLAGYPSSIQDRVIDAANEYQGIFSFNMEQNSGNPLGLGICFPINAYFCPILIQSIYRLHAVHYQGSRP